MNCFGFGFSMNSASSAANCDGSCAARTSSYYPVIAGIAAAMSVLFISALLSLRLSLGLLGLILLITIIVLLWLFSFCLYAIFPSTERDKSGLINPALSFRTGPFLYSFLCLKPYEKEK